MCAVTKWVYCVVDFVLTGMLLKYCPRDFEMVQISPTCTGVYYYYYY